jgi:hypothetical protein
MAIEKKDAGRALERPKPATARASTGESVRPAEATRRAGRAPVFDVATKTVQRPTPGMLANRWVKQCGSAASATSARPIPANAVNAG